MFCSDEMVIIINLNNTWIHENLLSPIVIIFYDYLVIFYAEKLAYVQLGRKLSFEQSISNKFHKLN